MPTSNPFNSVSREKSLRLALEDWNAKSGRLWGLRAEWSDKGWESFVAIEKEIFDGGLLHIDPGPFKCLGALCVLIQYYPFFDLLDSKKQPVSANEALIWYPRIATWCLPYNASVLLYNKEELAFDLQIPTVHLLVDFIGYLRSIRNSVVLNHESLKYKDMIVERTMTVGMIIEAATYASASPSPLLLDFAKKSAPSISKFDSVQQWDIYSCDPDYL